MSYLKSIINIFNHKKIEAVLPQTEFEEKAKMDLKPDQAPEAVDHSSDQPEAREDDKPAAGANPKRGETSLNRQPPESYGPWAAGEEDWQGKQAISFQIGDYILDTYLVEDIQAGGMGYVYITEHRGWKTKVAIKAPNQKMLSDRALFARVLKEADAWTGLGLHPHIAYCYYTRPVQDIPHIFIEYVDGGNLRDWISAARCYDLKLGLDLAIQFCHGMEYAHSYGMIHRDLKPENILMTKEGILKVTDFGIARTGFAGEENNIPGAGRKSRQENLERLTSLGAMGTYAYMSPQQFEDPRRVDPRDDIFSFGICLYEMFCGNRPYKASYPYLAAIEGESPADPQAFRSDLPPELAALLSQCCSLDREKRYNNFAEIRSQLIDIYRSIFKREPEHGEINPSNLKADGFNNRGVSYYYLGRADEARKCWQQALQADPQHLEATFNLGYVLWQRGELGAGEYLTRMKEIASGHVNNPDYWLSLGWIHLEQGNIEAIEEVQNSSHQINDREFLQVLNDPERPKGLLLHSLDCRETIASADFSRDGSRVLLGGINMAFALWDIPGGQEIQDYSLREHYLDLYEQYKEECELDPDMKKEYDEFGPKEQGVITSVCFSNDGSMALSGSDDGTIRLWETDSGVEVQEFRGHNDRVVSLCFSLGEEFILSGSGDWTMKLWDIYGAEHIDHEDGDLIRSYGDYQGLGYVRSVCFTADGQYAVTCSDDKQVRIWDLCGNQEPLILTGHTDHVNSVALSPDQRYILSGGEDYTMRLWDIASGKEIRCFRGHTGGVKTVCFSPDGRLALSGSYDHTVRIWDVESGRNIRQFDDHTSSVICAKFSGDGRLALSAGENGYVKAWEIQYPDRYRVAISPFPLVSRLKEVGVLTGERQKARKLLDQAKKYMSEGLYSKAYESLRDCQAIGEFERDQEVLDLLLKGGLEGKGRRSGLRGAWQLKNLSGHASSLIPGFVQTIDFSPDGRWAVSAAAWDQKVRIWDIPAGNEVMNLQHPVNIDTVCFSPDGKYIVTGGVDRVIRLWDVNTGQKLRQYADNRKDPDYIIGVVSISFSPDGRYFLSGSGHEHTISIWDIEKADDPVTFWGHNEVVMGVCFFEDMHSIVSVGLDDTIRIWDIKTGKEASRFDCLTGSWKAVAFSSDCQYILIGSRDNGFRLWDLNTGQEIRKFLGHTDSVISICFSPDDRFALSGGSDNTVRLWDIQSGEELRLFTGHTNTLGAVCFSPDGRYALSGGNDSNIKLWEFDWEWEF